MKLASNDSLAARMEDDVDLSAGGVAEGWETTAEVGQRLFELVLGTASGKRSASERLGFGKMEFVPWQVGATV